MRKRILFLICLWLGVVMILSAHVQHRNGAITGTHAFIDVESGKKLPDISSQFRFEIEWDMLKYELPWIVFDANKDGVPDSATKLDSTSYKKELEVMDMDRDGTIDEFAFFDKRGNIIFQAFDSDKDKQFDLWITVVDGSHIQRIQRDKDGDGYIDIDRIFGDSP